MDGPIERDFPDWMLDALQAEVATLPEAIGLWHHWLMSPDEGDVVAPPEVAAVLERIFLLQAEEEDFPSLVRVQ